MKKSNKEINVIQGLQLSTEQVKEYQKQKAQIKQQAYERIKTEVQTTLTESGFNISEMTVQEQLTEFYVQKYDSPEINAIIFNSFRKYNNSILTMDDIKQDIYLMLCNTKAKDLKIGYVYRYIKYFANDSCKNAINQYRRYMGNAKNPSTEQDNADFSDAITYRADPYQHMDEYDMYTDDFLSRLKRKQKEYCRMIQEGYTSREMRKKLHIDPDNMKNKIKNAMIQYGF